MQVYISWKFLIWGLSSVEKTKGVINPLFQIERLGYTKTFDDIKDSPQKMKLGAYNTDSNDMTIDKGAGRVTLAEGQRLDFGGFLKGHLAEETARRIMMVGTNIRGVIVNLGGDLHTRGADEDGMPFVFSIENPVTGEDIPVPLQNGSLATSGTYKRRWTADGKGVHHILGEDGRSNPKTDIVSASVLHERGAYADAYAKVLLIKGHNLAETTLDEDIRGIAIMASGAVHTYLS